MNGTGEEVVLFNVETNFLKFHVLWIPKHILLKPGIIYEIRFKQTPPVNCFTRIKMETTMLIEPDIVVEFYDDSTPENDGTARGLVQGLGFKRI